MNSLLTIRQQGDFVLTQKTQPITDFDDSLAKLAQQMFQVMYEAEGVGLAAPQIGILKSIFVYDDRNNHKGVICNPELYIVGREMEKDFEGCLSIPGEVRAKKRALRVSLSAQALEGKRFELFGYGYLARVYQHEFDHLQGRLITD